MVPTREFIPINEVAEKYCSQEHNRHSLVCRLIQNAFQRKLTLYCKKAIPPLSGERWFFIGETFHINKLLVGNKSLCCRPFLLTPRDRIKAYRCSLGINPHNLDVEVSMFDLYLDPYEVAILEKEKPTLFMLEVKDLINETDVLNPEETMRDSQPKKRIKNYTPLNKVTEKYGNLWENRCKLEKYLSERVSELKLTLYCKKAIPPTSEEQWFFIEDSRILSLPSENEKVKCKPFLLNLTDRINEFYERIRKQRSLEVEVSRADLYFDPDELVALEKEEPELFGVEGKAQPKTNPEDPSSVKPSDTSNGKSNIGINDKPVDHLSEEDDSGSDSLSPPALSDDIAKKSHSIAQAKKQNIAKPSKKKKGKADKLDIDRTIEAPLIWKNDREPLSLKTLADLQTRTLRLDDIIGNPKKGIPAIIRVSKSTWYAGVKSGLYPPSYELSPGCVAWRGADIYAFLKKKGLV